MFEVWYRVRVDATTCMSLYVFVSTYPAFLSVTMEKLSVLLMTNASPGPRDPIFLCFFKNIMLAILLFPVINFLTLIFHQHNSMMEYYLLKKKILVILPLLAPIPFLSSSKAKLLEKLSVSHVTCFSPFIFSWRFSSHSIRIVHVKVISDFPFAHLMTNLILFDLSDYFTQVLIP